ncbi:phosphohistidine phosphatase SixA [Tundrisphaera lichenicola]|uniref:phosphohistidine phosphatase SixA n=1 Tax=Tundrisphaera lichenicola TaxID=2029860 RepID=UPI003EBD008A
MQELYLLRHGLAVPHGTPGFEDDDRPLTPDGERRIRQIGRGLKRLKLKLVRIATSPLPRAFRTAEIVAECLGGGDLLEVVEELRPGSDAGSIRDWLKTRDETRLMIVGHNPAFSDLVGQLVTGREGSPICELRKGGIAALVGEPGGTYQLDWISRPKLFRA